jgi:hypothetical protein
VKKEVVDDSKVNDSKMAVNEDIDASSKEGI